MCSDLDVSAKLGSDKLKTLDRPRPEADIGILGRREARVSGSWYRSFFLLRLPPET